MHILRYVSRQFGCLGLFAGNVWDSGHQGVAWAGASQWSCHGPEFCGHHKVESFGVRFDQSWNFPSPLGHGTTHLTGSQGTCQAVTWRVWALWLCPWGGREDLWHTQAQGWGGIPSTLPPLVSLIFVSLRDLGLVSTFCQHPVALAFCHLGQFLPEDVLSEDFLSLRLTFHRQNIIFPLSVAGRPCPPSSGFQGSNQEEFSISSVL